MRRDNDRWQVVETYPDGERLVRYTGPGLVAVQVAEQFRQCGFRVEVRPEPKEGER